MFLASEDEVAAILALTGQSFVSKLITFVNPTNYYQIQDQQLHNYCDWIFSDGQLLTLLERKFGSNKNLNRVSFDFTSIADPVLGHCEEYGLGVAFVGATSDEIIRATSNIQVRYPGLRILHTQNGFFSKEEKIEVLRKLSGATVVIVGQGFPRQELFGIEIKKVYPNNKLIFTCGGFLTQTALKAEYYPKWSNTLHLRWLVRFFRHKHVRGKIMTEYPNFLIRFIITKFIRFK